jgi:rhodanese-related sulfurtransferase
MKIILKIIITSALMLAVTNVFAQKISSFDAEKFNFALSEDKNPQIVDVRTKTEFDAEHIKGAINIDINQIDFQKKVAKKLKKDRIVYVYCTKGVRSFRAAEILENLDFIRIYNLKGGLEAWKKQGYAIKKKRDLGNL